MIIISKIAPIAINADQPTIAVPIIIPPATICSSSSSGSDVSPDLFFTIAILIPFLTFLRTSHNEFEPFSFFILSNSDLTLEIILSCSSFPVTISQTSLLETTSSTLGTLLDTSLNEVSLTTSLSNIDWIFSFIIDPIPDSSELISVCSDIITPLL